MVDDLLKSELHAFSLMHYFTVYKKYLYHKVFIANVQNENYILSYMVDTKSNYKFRTSGSCRSLPMLLLVYDLISTQIGLQE